MGSCASYGPYHANTAAEPLNSVRGPADGRYKLAFIEFGDQGSPLDTSQRKAALEVIHKAQRPLLFVYIHGWQNNAVSGDVCRFEHFLDTVSSFPEFTGRKIDVIGVYIAWRGKDLTFPGLNLLTFWSRKSTGGGIAAANSCLATIEELAVAAREPGKEYHHTVLLGHSFGALVLGNTISHSILGANGEGGRSSSAWDMAVAFNSADNSITTRQLMSEFDYLYKYDPQKRAYVSRGNLGEETTAVSENRPALVLLQSENDSATGQFFPIGQEVVDVTNLHFHWQKVPVPGTTAKKSRKTNFIPTRQATANTSSIITSFRLEKPVRRQVCERLRTGPSKPISSKTVPIFHFTRASKTTVMKATSVAMATTLPVMSIHQRKRNSGGSGNLNIPATPAYLIGSCACQRTLFGVMEDCGATTPSQCWAPFFASNSRWQAAKWQLPSRLPRRRPRICSS